MADLYPFKPLVLIHGAWQGAWAWDALLPFLEAAGHEVHAIELPGGGRDDTPAEHVTLDRYVDHVGAIVAAIGRPAVLIAHSGGGVIASQCAERFPELVDGIIYLAGMMLPSFGSFGDVIASLQTEGHDAVGVGRHLVWNEDRSISRVPEAAAIEVFYHDAPPAAAGAAAARLTFQEEGGRALRPALTEPRFGSVSRVYVEALQDRSVILAAQREMQRLVPGAEILQIDTGHAPQLSRPEELARLLLTHLNGTQGREAVLF